MRSIRHDLYIFNGNDEKLSIIEYNDHKKEKTSRALLNSTVYLVATSSRSRALFESDQK